jgi:hypothetical protein
MTRPDHRTAYEAYLQQVQYLQERAAGAVHPQEWQNIKREVTQLARGCPYFDFARLCFQLLAQTAAHTPEWHSIKSEATDAARECPFRDIARRCFQLLSQAQTALRSAAYEKNYS